MYRWFGSSAPGMPSDILPVLGYSEIDALAPLACSPQAANEPARMSSRPQLPTAAMGIAVGTLAFEQLWGFASLLWPWASVWRAHFTPLALSLWALLLALFVRRWWREPRILLDEISHPQHAPFIALLPVSTLLAAMSMRPVWPDLATAMLVTGLVAQGVATLWLAAPMWQGRRPMETWSAATYLPTVAQNFVAASAAMQFGWTDLAPLLFGAGLLSWLSLESVILLRAASHGEMPSAARPAQGIQMAPPFVAAMAWLSLNCGHVDLVAQMLFGYGWLQAALALRLMRWSSQAGLVLGYWAYSFGVMAMASTAIRIAAERPFSAFWQHSAQAMFLAAHVVMGLLVTVSALHFKRR